MSASNKIPEDLNGREKELDQLRKELRKVREIEQSRVDAILEDLNSRLVAIETRQPKHGTVKKVVKIGLGAAIVGAIVAVAIR